MKLITVFNTVNVKWLSSRVLVFSFTSFYAGSGGHLARVSRRAFVSLWLITLRENYNESLLLGQSLVWQEKFPGMNFSP
jgi:hypothetical protein